MKTPKPRIGEGQPVESVTPPAYKKMSPEDIDNLMKWAAANAGKTGHRMWTEPMLAIRRQAIIDHYAQGNTVRELIGDIMDRWEATDKQARTYVKDALEWLQEGNEEFRDYNRDQQIEKLERIAKDAKSAGEYKAAVAAIAEVNKLLGLGEQKVNVSVERVFKFDGD